MDEEDRAGPGRGSGCGHRSQLAMLHCSVNHSVPHVRLHEMQSLQGYMPSHSNGVGSAPVA
jgi:hypothetical protein